MTLDRWSRRTFSFSKLATGVLLALAMAPALAEAQGTVNFQVTNLNDSGPGSLREAIEDANASNADTKIITFDVVNDGTINLLTDLPEISPDGVTIDGSTAVNLSINAGGVTTQILDLGDDTSTTTVTDIALSGGPIKIGSGASMSFDVSADQQFDNVIADAQTDDAGRLIKEGAATLTLGGANTYTGGTLVRAGTLRGDTTSLQGDIAVDGGAVVEFNQTDDDSFDGAITGQGAVLKTGAAELELTGANTYAGNTTISAGSLRGDAGSLQGNISVANNAAVIFEHDNDDEYSGDLTGAGGFTKEGAGTLTLSGANTISGASSLDGGALIGGAASIPRNLTTAAGTSVTFDDGENDGTYSGSLKGAGDFVKLGTGTLTLSGNNSNLTGQASLDAGALRGGPAGIPANLATAAGTSVIFNHANNGTYAGAISGSADVTKSGSGALTLSGANTFTGLTSLTGGRLYVEGSLVGGVDVAAGTVLGGTGSIGGPVDVNGTVAPGNSIGELTVDSVVFAPGSVFAVEVAESGAGDRLTVLGNADLAGGSVTVDPGAGSYLAPVDVTILSAASINGDFASFGPDFAFLDITHITDATSVVLTIQRNAMGLAEYAETPNQSTIAAALEAARLAGTDPDIETVFESLDVLTVNQVPGVLNAMTGETLTQFATARLATAQRFGRSLDARIREYQWDNKSALIGGSAAAGAASELAAASGRDQSAPIFGVAMLGVGPMGAPRTGTTVKPDPLLRAWIDGSGIYGDVDGNSNESAFDYTIWGGSLGADLRLAEHWVLGIAGGYANTDLDFSDRPGEGDIDTFQGALYAGYVDPKFHLGVSGRYAYNDMDGNREIGFGLNRKASADIDGDDYGARFESGLNLLDLGGFVFQPMASVDYNRLDQDSFTEGGAGSLNLAVEDNDLDSLVLGVGMRVHGSWQVDDGLWIVPELTGRWLHEFLDTDRQIEARLVSNLAASAFQIQGVELPRDSGSVGVAWNVITDSAWSVIGSYDAILNADLVQHVGSITISFEF
jgi:autotransporter-associated beta strand protein